MAGNQEKASLFMNYSALKEEVGGGDHIHEYYEDDDGVSWNGCGCFRLFSFRPRNNQQSNNEGRRILVQQKAVQEEESWVVKKLKKVKEVSEMVAGPRWKTFIRKMGGYLKGTKKGKNRFQYDPESYALNFDRSDDEDAPPLGFSARFAVPLPSREQH